MPLKALRSKFFGLTGFFAYLTLATFGKYLFHKVLDIQIKVPVKPYVRNYLLSLVADEPLVLAANSDNLVLDKLYDLLSRDTRQAGQRWRDMPSQQDYTETITVRLKNWSRKIGGFHLSEEKIKRFNTYVDQLIRDRLFIQLDTLMSLYGFETYPQDVKRCQLPIDIKQVILSYMDFHNLEEGGLKYDTIKRAYQRFRNERHRTMGGALSVPLFSVLQNPEIAA